LPPCGRGTQLRASGLDQPFARFPRWIQTLMLMLGQPWIMRPGPARRSRSWESRLRRFRLVQHRPGARSRAIGAEQHGLGAAGIEIGIPPMLAGLAPRQHPDIASAQCRPRGRQFVVIGARGARTYPPRGAWWDVSLRNDTLSADHGAESPRNHPRHARRRRLNETSKPFGTCVRSGGRKSPLGSRSLRRYSVGHVGGRP
jgi:hypothetical protein